MSAWAGLLIGVPLCAVLLWALVYRRWERQPPWAHLAVASVASSTAVTSVLDEVSAGEVPAWAVAFAFLAWSALLAVYPDGRVQPSWAVMPLGALAAAIVLRASTGGSFDTGPWPVVLTGGLLLGTAAQVWRYRRRSSLRERDAVRWLLAGAVPALTFLLGLGLVVATTVVPEQVYELDAVRAASELAFWLVPLAATAGLLAPARPAADRVVHGAVTLCLVALALVECYSLALPSIGHGWAAVLVVALQVPALLTARAVASVLVYGRDARPALARLGAHLESAIGPDEVPGTVADAVRSALAVPYAAVVVGEDGIAESGTPPADHTTVDRFPVVYDSRQVAEILVAVRPGDRRFSRRDRDVVHRLALRAGGALHGAAVMTDLRAAREDLVVAREEERRRLRRDLHDDLAPALAGLAMRAAAVAALAQRDDQVAAVADGLEEGLRGAADQVRQIAYDLRPALLDDRGLVDAVRDRVERDGDDRLVVTVDADDVGTLPAAVELAALRIVTESVNNARRHAHADRCDVTLVRQDGHLSIEVRDDGEGIAPGRPTGIGLPSIRERSSELGGDCAISSDRTGTTVHVRLPLEEDR